MANARKLVCLAISLALIWPTQSAIVWALSDDSQQPIEIESNTAEFRDAEGLTIYRGNVRLTQGSIELLAEEITLISDNNRIVRLIALGNPAQYSQSLDRTGEKVVAESLRMEYQMEDGVLNLTLNARLTQQGTTLSGNQIRYDVLNQVLQASSQGESRQERVRVTIPAANPQEGGTSSP